MTKEQYDKSLIKLQTSSANKILFKLIDNDLTYELPKDKYLNITEKELQSIQWVFIYD